MNPWGRLGASVMAVALLAGTAGAANIAVVPTKLIVVDKLVAANKAKTVFVAKNAAVTKGAGLDVEQISVQLDVTFGVGSAVGVFTIPAGSASGWLANNASVAKYVNRAAPAGPTETKVAVIKPGKLLKLVGKGLGDTELDILGAGNASGPVYTAYCVTNGAEENCHCSRFTGCILKSIAGGTGAKLVCKSGTGDDCTSCFVDQGLTVLDTCTNLEWEKKDGADVTPGSGTVDAGNLHDVDNPYSWAGYCSIGGTRCQPDAAAAATCATQTGGALGCTECGVGEGTCDMDHDAITTIWDWVNQVNAAGFAGHNDWRLATSAGSGGLGTGEAAELESIMDVGFSPRIDPIFGPTVAWGYWSASTLSIFPDFAWAVWFLDGPDGAVDKDSDMFVRAVRPGS
jgi:hypothetical protein